MRETHSAQNKHAQDAGCLTGRCANSCQLKPRDTHNTDIHLACATPAVCYLQLDWQLPTAPTPFPTTPPPSQHSNPAQQSPARPTAHRPPWPEQPVDSGCVRGVKDTGNRSDVCHVMLSYAGAQTRHQQNAGRCGQQTCRQADRQDRRLRDRLINAPSGSTRLGPHTQGLLHDNVPTPPPLIDSHEARHLFTVGSERVSPHVTVSPSSLAIFVTTPGQAKPDTPAITLTWRGPAHA